MKKEFMGEDFLLEDEISKKLYFEHAQKMPIFDYHCHLSPKEIAEDHRFSSITEAWLGQNGAGDHYKWRLLRELGIEEEYITGDKSPKEKFDRFCLVMPYLVGNPVYQWTHLELKRYFGIEKTLCPENAEYIWNETNKQLKDLTARKILQKMHVDSLFTTDDPVDDLHYHELMGKDTSLKTKVLPAFRPDKALNIERDTFRPWIKALEKTCSRSVTSLNDLLQALDERLAFFVEHGCLASDHALDSVHYKKGTTYEEAEKVFLKGLKGEEISSVEQDAYKGFLLVHLGKEYHKYGMVQQYHIGALRNNSTRMYSLLGADSGFDAVGDQPYAEKLSGLLDELDKSDELPKTILYTLNDADYPVLVTLMNCYQKGGIKGKIQLGTAWWFQDHFDGMNKQLSYLASDGLLSCFVGMLTDSRSFLSYPRHEYFRRIFCAYLGKLVMEGKYPEDMKTLGQIVEDVSFNNAKKYFSRS
ncbi:MAG: glucuronate isomerase [Bacilli bacterium]|jgi:glucuronate isomerase|nr:glucuronate isomerase [Bacilli bacterium]